MRQNIRSKTKSSVRFAAIAKTVNKDQVFGIEEAIALGVDLYLSGEISEQTVHLARESGVAYLAAGHHASERYGALALAGHLAERFGLDCQFVDLDNPV